MELSFTEKKSIRKNFGKLKEILSIPNLIEVQKKSYREFLTPSDQKEPILQKGLESVFKTVFQLKNYQIRLLLSMFLFVWKNQSLMLRNVDKEI